jgi:hypothetical protein
MKDMTDLEIQTRIAKLLGWIKNMVSREFTGGICGDRYTEMRDVPQWYLHDKAGHLLNCVDTEDLPDYLNDLNAAAEAEKLVVPWDGDGDWRGCIGAEVIISEGEESHDESWARWFKYQEILEAGESEAISATARQRTEAIITVMEKV